MTDSEELARRLAGPQRHRLLQGYPMLPLMRPAVTDGERHRRLDGSVRSSGKDAVLRAARVASAILEPPHLTLDGDRPLVIGIIPHTACNPRVEGCGFCTFPHDVYDKQQVRHSVGRVEHELKSLLDGIPSWRGGAWGPCTSAAPPPT
jgi:hypothetical protein